MAEDPDSDELLQSDDSWPLWRRRLHEIIFEADTPAGKRFDVILLWVIALSVAAVMLESVESINAKYGRILNTLEWIFTIAFTVEYILRIVTVRKPKAYIFSFFGIIDLMACLPTYLSLLFPQSEYFLVIRILRMLRVFRILKMGRHLREGRIILNALRASRAKITVFLFGILSLAIIMGTVMYLVESPYALLHNAGSPPDQFTSIPQSVYWAIVTITTVGYGDITPHTIAGQMIAALMMIMGYAIIAVPTGVVTVELIREFREDVQTSTRSCAECLTEGHRLDARFCFFCGAKLENGSSRDDSSSPSTSIPP
ncbi:MAG: ion transporter [Verrucomicrobiota bacterium]